MAEGAKLYPDRKKFELRAAALTGVSGYGAKAARRLQARKGGRSPVAESKPIVASRPAAANGSLHHQPSTFPDFHDLLVVQTNQCPGPT